LGSAVSALLLVGIGCSGSHDTNSVTNPNPSTFTPKGTVNGVLLDVCTNLPIAGAKVNILGRNATTNSDGGFQITDVPANTAKGNEPGNVLNDTYPVVIDLTDYNKALHTGVAHYPTIVYDVVDVKYDSLGDSNPGSSANHDTPVNGFVASIVPYVGKLDTQIKLQVVGPDYEELSGASVKLLATPAVGSVHSTSNGANMYLVEAGTTDATGWVTFGATAGLEARRTFMAEALSADGTLIAGPGSVYQAPCDTETMTYGYQADQATHLNGQGLMLTPIDAMRPVLTTVIPANLTDIPWVAATPSFTVTFRFSEPIQMTPYALAVTQDKVKSLGGGLWNDVAVNYDGPKASNTPFTMAWSTDREELTVTVPAAPASKYSIDLTAALANLKDDSGNLVNASGAFAVNPSTHFTTAGGVTPTLPVITTTNDQFDPFFQWTPGLNTYQYAVVVKRYMNGILTATSDYYANSTYTSDTVYDLSGNPLWGPWDGVSNRGAGPVTPGAVMPVRDMGFACGQLPVTYSVQFIAMSTAGVLSPGLDGSFVTAADPIAIADTFAPQIAVCPQLGTLGLTVPATALVSADLAGFPAGTQTVPMAADVSTDYTATIAFNETMTRAAVENAANWSVAAATVTTPATPGGAWVPSAAILPNQVAGYTDILPVIKSISGWDPSSNTVTITFTLTNTQVTDPNAPAGPKLNRTWDPRHVVFTFANGKDVSGNVISAAHDSIDYASNNLSW